MEQSTSLRRKSRDDGITPAKRPREDPSFGHASPQQQENSGAPSMKEPSSDDGQEVIIIYEKKRSDDRVIDVITIDDEDDYQRPDDLHGPKTQKKDEKEELKDKLKQAIRNEDFALADELIIAGAPLAIAAEEHAKLKSSKTLNALLPQTFEVLNEHIRNAREDARIYTDNTSEVFVLTEKKRTQVLRRVPGECICLVFYICYAEGTDGYLVGAKGQLENAPTANGKALMEANWKAIEYFAPEEDTFTVEVQWEERMIGHVLAVEVISAIRPP